MSRVETIEELEALYPGIAKMSPATTEKETAVINDEYRRLIEATPFFAMTSVGEEGTDCSPRGDGAGCIHILDDNTIAFADRRGNNRLDTLRNIVLDPRVSLLCMIPLWNETLRINGRAHVSADPELIKSFEFKGKLPATVVVIKIDTMYFQCARALKRAKLWEPETWQDASGLPTAGQLVKSTMPEFDANTYDQALPGRQAETMY